MSEKNKSIISFKKVIKTLGNKKVLDCLDLDIYDGETVVVIGRSGEGKSVLLKHIIGILRADEGNIIVDGEDITNLEISSSSLENVRKKIGFLFQGAALFDSMTVAENVGFGLRKNTDLNEDEIGKIVREKLSLVGLEGVEDKKPSELSGGMKKRVGLARAIAMNPKIILYDEPTTGLDPIMADTINEMIKNLQKKLGVTSVAVTHDMVSAYKIADRIAMLYKGKILESGSPSEIKKSKDPIIRQFIIGSATGPIG